MSNEFKPHRSQVPSVDVSKIIQSTVTGSNGQLEFISADAGQEDPLCNCRFSFCNAIFVPGPKHLLDNIIGDMLARMTHFEEFQGNLKICCETWHCIGLCKFFVAVSDVGYSMCEFSSPCSFLLFSNQTKHIYFRKVIPTFMSRIQCACQISCVQSGLC